MVRWKAVSVTLLVFAALMALGLKYAADSLTRGLCGNTPIQAVSSPDGSRQAILFERNCGATTDVSFQISIFAAGESLPNESGNIFIAAGDDSGQGASWGGPWVELVWTDANALRVRHDQRARVVKAEPRLGELRITFEAVDRDAGRAGGDGA